MKIRPRLGRRYTMGFAAHVKVNAEALRDRLVRHEGQAELRVRRDDLVKGSPVNPWPEVFPSFSDQIAAHIGRRRDLLVCDFSTTGPCERAASEVILMDAMSGYFRFVFSSLCGIPSITLEGTPEDYRAIRRRTQAFSEYDLSWWTEALLPILDRFIEASEGRADVPFWRSIFKRLEASGGAVITGWINAFFPYLLANDGLQRNPWIHKDLASVVLKDPMSGRVVALRAIAGASTRHERPAPSARSWSRTSPVTMSRGRAPSPNGCESDSR